MPEQTYAARLRERAATGRAELSMYPFPQLVFFKPVTLDPDEADAIANVLEAAADENDPCLCVPHGQRCRRHEALSALDRRAQPDA